MMVIFWWFFGLLILNAYGDYYAIHAGFTNIKDSISDCDERDQYLASADSEGEFQSLIDLCESVTEDTKDNHCWIGLKFIYNHTDNITKYSWTDHTEFNTDVSQLWCDNYPIINTSMTGYIYIHQNCLKNTINNITILPDPVYHICGPSMKPDKTYWTSKCIPILIACFVLFIGFISMLNSLYHHFIRFDHNWIIPPTKSVICSALSLPIIGIIGCFSAILYCSLMYIGYKTTGILVPTSFPPDYEYPNVYWVSYICIYIAVISAALIPIIGYTHILLRLKNICDENELMANVIPFKNKRICYVMIILLIILMIPPALFIAFGHSNKLGIKSHEMQDVFATIGILTVCTLFVIINGILLAMYVSGLFRLSKEFHTRVHAQNGLLDDRQHELMLEAARYVVVFSILMVCDFSFGVICAVMRAGEYDNNAVTVISAILGFIEMVLFIQSIFLSFVFNHTIYERICCYCDKCVKRLFQHIVKKNNQAIELQSSLLQVNGDVL